MENNKEMLSLKRILKKYNKRIDDGYLIEDNDHGLLEIHKYNEDVELSKDLKFILQNMTESYIKHTVVWTMLINNQVVELIGTTAGHDSDPRQYYEMEDYLSETIDYLEDLSWERDENIRLCEELKDEPDVVKEVLKRYFKWSWDA